MFSVVSLLFVFIVFFTICIICYTISINSKCSMYPEGVTIRQKDEFTKSKGESVYILEENLQTNSDDLQNGDLGFKVSTKINKERENDQFYFNPKIANCGQSRQQQGLNCAKSIYGQEFPQGWFV